MPLVEALQAALQCVFNRGVIFVERDGAIELGVFVAGDFVRRVILRHEIEVGVG